MNYTLAGDFSGQIISSQYFPNQAEGIALFACTDGTGYWIATDQADYVSTFHLFDRRTLDPLGTFRGKTVRNTDGIALSQKPFGAFTAGAFFAVHDDGNVAAFQWRDIASSLDLMEACS